MREHIFDAHEGTDCNIRLIYRGSFGRPGEHTPVPPSPSTYTITFGRVIYRVRVREKRLTLEQMVERLQKRERPSK